MQPLVRYCLALVHDRRNRCVGTVGLLLNLLRDSHLVRQERRAPHLFDPPKGSPTKYKTRVFSYEPDRRYCALAASAEVSGHPPTPPDGILVGLKNVKKNIGDGSPIQGGPSPIFQFRLGVRRDPIPVASKFLAGRPVAKIGDTPPYI